MSTINISKAGTFDVPGAAEPSAPSTSALESKSPPSLTGLKSRTSSAASLSPRSSHLSLGGSPARRMQLLDAYRASLERPVFVERAVDAIKLRAAAQVYLPKNEARRFMPGKLQAHPGSRRLEELVAMEVDELIADVEKNPSRYSRTLLNDVAQRHLVAAIDIDESAMWAGVKKSAPWEGMHSVAGRVSTLATSLSMMGVSELVPGAGRMASAAGRSAVKATSKAVKFIGHQGPSTIWNPYITGKLRMLTNVKQNRKLTGGQPKLASNIAKSHDMGVLSRRMSQQRTQLEAANQAYRAASDSGQDTNEALRAMVDAYLELHGTVNDAYKSRIGANRSQTYSKGYGAGVNAIAGAGAVLSVALPGAGQVVGPAMQAACVPLQAVAGYLDEFTKHGYNLRANTKWGDFLTDEGKRVHFKDLKPHHVVENTLRAAHLPAEQLSIADVREVYECDLAERLATQDALRDKLAAITASPGGGTPNLALASLHEELAATKAAIDARKAHVALFESFDDAAWKSIPGDSLIGQCVDDRARLEKAQRKARDKLLGEAERQVLQRYVQALHSGASSGVTLPIADAVGFVDGLHVRADGGALDETAQDAVVSLGAAGSAVFVSLTGEVRMTKGDNGARLRAKVTPEHSRRADKLEQDEQDWTFEAAGRKIDLRNSSAYDRLYHSRLQRCTRLAKAALPSLVSGPKGLIDLACAQRERRSARSVMQQTLVMLAADGAATPGPRRADNFSAMKDRLHDHPAVAGYLRADKGKAVETIDHTTPFSPPSPHPSTIDLDLELEAMAQKKVVHAAGQPPAPAPAEPPRGGTFSTDLTDEELARILAHF
jgi:hypothetical protein